MGYSCTAKASYVLQAILSLLQERGTDKGKTSNGWSNKGTSYFFEQGRENKDGAITGTVIEYSAHSSRSVGGARIEPNGTISRFPTTTAKMRGAAEEKGKNEYRRVYEPAFA